MELRKKAKITDGILLLTRTVVTPPRGMSAVFENVPISEIQLPGQTQLVEYAPGNGTRYVLVVADLTSLGEDLQRIGRTKDEPCYLVAWVNGGSGKAMTVGSGLLHHRYVREKLECSVSDAVVLAELIGWLCDVEAVSCEDFAADKG